MMTEGVKRVLIQFQIQKNPKNPKNKMIDMEFV